MINTNKYYDEERIYLDVKRFFPDQKNLINNFKDFTSPMVERFLNCKQAEFNLFIKYKNYYVDDRNFPSHTDCKKKGWLVGCEKCSFDSGLLSFYQKLHYIAGDVISFYSKEIFKGKNIQELVNSDSIYLLQNKETISISKFMLSKNDWIQVVNHEIEKIDPKNAKQIKNNIIQSYRDINSRFSEGYHLERKLSGRKIGGKIEKKYIWKEIENNYESENHITELNKIIQKYEKENTPKSFLEIQDYSEKKYPIKMDKMVRLFQTFFYLNCNNIDEIENFNQKIENSIKASLISTYGKAKPKNDDRIDFLDKELRDKFILFFILLDMHFKIFNHVKAYTLEGLDLKLNGSDISDYFIDNIFPTHNSNINLTKGSFGNKIHKLRKHEKPYGFIKFERNDIKRFLCNSTTHNDKLIITLLGFNPL